MRSEFYVPQPRGWFWDACDPSRVHEHREDESYNPYEFTVVERLAAMLFRALTPR